MQATSREVRNMDENVSKEIAKAAEVLGVEIEETETKFMEICKEHNLDPETESKYAVSLFRQWFSGKYAYKDAPQQESSGGGSFIKKAVGYFISVDASQDMGARFNEQIKAEYERDPTTAYDSTRVAIAIKDGDGYSVSRMYDGETQTKAVEALPANNYEVDTGKWIIPLDSMQAYGERKNPNYGKPLPASQNRMSGIFLGEVDGDAGLYFFSYKGEASKEFSPTPFKLLYFDCIRDSNVQNRVYGFKTGTLDSLKYNSDLEEPADEPDVVTMQNYTMEQAMDHYSPLLDLNRYHGQMADKRFAERFVITDGSVSNINMTPNKMGSRRMVITDLNSDFDYEGGSWAGTTCWIPPHLDVDFGLNSGVVVVGRTTQGRNDDGSLRDVSLNVSGILVTENRGVVVEPFEVEEEDLDWF